MDASEKLLMSEPDGSFILRDSSDDHYIFTISFKLNGGVRHVRIEHDQGMLFTLFKNTLTYLAWFCVMELYLVSNFLTLQLYII